MQVIDFQVKSRSRVALNKMNRPDPDRLQKFVATTIRRLSMKMKNEGNEDEDEEMKIASNFFGLLTVYTLYIFISCHTVFHS